MQGEFGRMDAEKARRAAYRFDRFTLDRFERGTAVREDFIIG